MSEFPPPPFQVIHWGRTRYKDAFARQLSLVDQRKDQSIGDTLVLNEHHPVFTIGVRSGAANHLVWSQDTLANAGIEIEKTNRGGDITYHGPGQIVGYPILDWSQQKDLHAYLRLLEESLIQTVAHFGLKAARRSGKTGIWIEDRKLAAIGVAVKSWITYHGFALNVHPDLNHFNGIIPCGITDGTVTSLQQELQRPIQSIEVEPILIESFRKTFYPSSVH